VKDSWLEFILFLNFEDNLFWQLVGIYFYFADVGDRYIAEGMRGDCVLLILLDDFRMV